jgi:putative FmdB family regulatory protein
LRFLVRFSLVLQLLCWLSTKSKADKEREDHHERKRCILPTYQYECQNCENRFEEKQKFSDPPLTDCPICQAVDTVQRVIGPVGVIFKGSGFYINDSKKGKSSSSSSSTSTTANSDSSDKSDATESKAPAAETKETKETKEPKAEKSEAKTSES